MATPVANTAAELLNKRLLTTDDDNDVAGELTFERAPAAPFTVQAGSAVVPNLDADKLDGVHAAAFALLAGPNVLAGALSETGIISPTQLLANTDDWAPTGFATCRVIRASSDASRNLTGIAAPTTGLRVLLCNIGAQNIVLKHDATSTAANRFYGPGAADYTLGANESVELWYDLTSARWRILGTA